MIVENIFVNIVDWDGKIDDTTSVQRNASMKLLGNFGSVT